MENLNKENFWNELYEKYPLGMKVFCDWIDEYKKKNNWKMLFNSNSEYQNADGKNAIAPKYHDLPLAMQIGIWIEFCSELSVHEWEVDDLCTYDWKADITECFKMLQVDKEV